MEVAKKKYERRHYERHIVNSTSKVFVYHRQKKITFGYIQDISKNGVLLTNLKNLSIPVGSIVKLVFAVELNDTLVNIHRKSGMIVRTHSNTDAAVTLFHRK